MLLHCIKRKRNAPLKLSLYPFEQAHIHNLATMHVSLKKMKEHKKAFLVQIEDLSARPAFKQQPGNPNQDITISFPCWKSSACGMNYKNTVLWKHTVFELGRDIP